MILCPEGRITNALSRDRERIEQVRRLLVVVWTVQTLLACLSLPISFWLCLSEFIASFVLLLAITQLNYCNCVFYLVSVAFNMLHVVTIVGEKLQGAKVDPMEEQPFSVIVCFVTIAFDGSTIPIAFHAYKQFKEMVYEMIISQTSAEPEEEVTCETAISINGFQQQFKLIDLEQPLNQPRRISKHSSLFDHVTTDTRGEAASGGEGGGGGAKGAEATDDPTEVVIQMELNEAGKQNGMKKHLFGTVKEIQEREGESDEEAAL